MAHSEQKGVLIDRNKWLPIRIPEQSRKRYTEEKEANDAY